MSFLKEESSGDKGGVPRSNGTRGGGVERLDISDGYSGGLVTENGNKFHHVYQLNHADQSGECIVQSVKSSDLDNAPTHSLFGVVNRILDESIDRKNGDISNQIAFVLRKVLHIVEQRMSRQVEVLRSRSNLYRVREEKYISRIEVLETLTQGISEENKVFLKNLHQLKNEMITLEEKRKLEELNTLRSKKEKDDAYAEVFNLKQEYETAKSMYEKHCTRLEAEAKEAKVKSEELKCELDHSQKKVAELEEFTESKYRRCKKKEIKYERFISFQFEALQNLRAASAGMKKEVLKSRRRHAEELNYLGGKLKGLVDAAQNYHAVLTENRRLYNELQDLKGNIRVYCRIRPFLPGQNMKQTTIEYIGDDGELVVANPTKKGKENQKLFKFNKVFSPAATQEEVYLDTQPLIRSVLDGYNVCIFAYGQTGSGKTYTMSGPSLMSQEDWGVNYRALNDLFQIAQSRGGSIIYEIAVQMVEIYNEQVRDLLSTRGSQKRLGIWSVTQPNGLAVPEASMHSVNNTTDVLELMSVGLANRAVGATALNERSSRSHSILTIHVQGTDLETKAVLRGNLHLIDLAGSERVDRSEATGDRLREAQHINKSLSALGDVIFSLALKSSHVPYRNSKLTQVLQSSLGGQAKTLMFVQLNPDVDSYSETISTLKFAERVSGVELGAARSNKEGRDVRELIEQVALLKDTIAKKDGEIDRLQSLVTDGSSSPRRHSIGTPQLPQKNCSGRVLRISDKGASDGDNCSEYSDKHSEAGSQQSVDELKHQRDLFPLPSKLPSNKGGAKVNEDVNLVGLGDGDYEERLSDISDGGLSMGAETDGSVPSIVEYTLFPESAEQSEKSKISEKQKIPSSKLPKPPQKKLLLPQSKASRLARSDTKIPSSARKPVGGSSSSIRPVKRR